MRLRSDGQGASAANTTVVAFAPSFGNAHSMSSQLACGVPNTEWLAHKPSAFLQQLEHIVSSVS